MSDLAELLTDLPEERAWIYMGERRYVEGVPFGSMFRRGDHYVSATPMSPDDVDLAKTLRLRDAAAGLLAKECERLAARPCPHVVTGDEGTSYCDLAANAGPPPDASGPGAESPAPGPTTTPRRP